MSEWIDVNKRLPSTMDDVLVLIKDCSEAFFTFDDENLHRYGYGVAWYAGKKDGWRMQCASYYDGTRSDLQTTSLVKNYISHWQPLPKPPHGTPREKRGESDD